VIIGTNNDCILQSGMVRMDGVSNPTGAARLLHLQMKYCVYDNASRNLISSIGLQAQIVLLYIYLFIYLFIELTSVKDEKLNNETDENT
jgi:hypothetical protein